MFNPYYLPFSLWSNQMLSRRFPVKRLNSKGIPSLETTAVSTTGSVVVYQLCPWRFKQLCNEGLMLLRISQTPPTGSSTYTVSLQTLDNSQSIPLISGSGATVASSRVIKGNYLLIYFNKSQGIFQLVNDIPTA